MLPANCLSSQGVHETPLAPLPADKGVYVDSVPKLSVFFLAHFRHLVGFVPESHHVNLATKRDFVNNLRPVTEESPAFLDIIRILRPYFEPLH